MLCNYEVPNKAITLRGADLIVKLYGFCLVLFSNSLVVEGKQTCVSEDCKSFFPRKYFV